jgi:hypothetical protein
MAAQELDVGIVSRKTRKGKKMWQKRIKMRVN